MKPESLYFTGPGEISIREETLPPLQPGQVLVRTLLSAISPGTEMLVYRGQFPVGLLTDETISSLAGEFRYPLKYGYASVGRVIQIGSPALTGWKEQIVFSFHPHESHFIASPGELKRLPEGVTIEDAVFLPNMETALNLVMDGNPLIGERVLVFGQGIVGLLTTLLLASFPLACLVTLDRYPLRRKASTGLGAIQSINPDTPDTRQQIEALFPSGADLAFECSGSPDALDEAIACTGFEGRVVIGSWYGQKRACLDLGGRFHRSRIRLISSQVSTLASGLAGRWTKERRFELAWEMIRRARPSHLITQRFPFSQASLAYDLIDQHPEEAIQVVLTYTQ
jgi:2-desacetyl-2-hydroxyethyl bacteriochlorophyllide A dehydrogenase